MARSRLRGLVGVNDAGAYRSQALPDAALRLLFAGGGGGLIALRAALNDRLEQVADAAVEQVAQRGEGVDVEPLGLLSDEPLDLLAREFDAALGERRDQVGR